ncbi:phage integrase family protein [Pseudaquabacterium terrae]|uniref:phage integrase family protein n=1 Tax=Pseudaquabacterium terrae TaxID=2732868 RepID=UPI001C262303|nr:phage integrase family protein [Aquabacterium terrae]
MPDSGQISALRAWHEGFSSRDAVERFLPGVRSAGESARGVIGRIRRQIAAFARVRHRDDLAALFEGPAKHSAAAARRVVAAVEALRTTALPRPLIGDDVERWLPPRTIEPLHAAGIRTLADLTVRVPRRRRWWSAIAGLGVAHARQIEAFFAAHPDLTERARALVVLPAPSDVSPWERIVVPEEVDGSRGLHRAPRESCALRASNDYEAVQAWLSMHEAPATQRAYRKEAERLILWAIVERGCALSSLATEDAVAYRTFLRHPSPRGRWVGPPRPRTAPDWRPFSGALSARSTAYALSVLNALFRWLIEQRYMLANPFAGLKVRGTKAAVLDAGRAFTESEWNLVRTLADGLEWSYGWEAPAAQRLRFILDFGYGTGLRASELVGAKLGRIELDPHGDHWLRVVGKGSKAGKVSLPPIAREALDRYLAQRGLPVTPAKWASSTRLLGNIPAAVGEADEAGGITTGRLWALTKRFFATAAGELQEVHPALAEKLRRATPHWMRHTHATHALERGVELTTVRDNLRHSSVSTTSIYLHTDDRRRAEQMRRGFSGAKDAR